MLIIFSLQIKHYLDVQHLLLFEAIGFLNFKTMSSKPSDDISRPNDASKAPNNFLSF